MTNEEIAIKQHLAKPRPIEYPCGCLGPQRTDPVCPCEMRWCENVNGVWFRIAEHRSTSGITLSATQIK